MEKTTQNQPQIGRFLAGVSGLIYRPSDGKYLVLQRSSEKDFGRGAWESVSGRVNQGESFEEALHREVHEELGIEVQVDFIIGTMHFYRGPAEPANELIGVEYCCSILHEDAIHLNKEHSQSRWVSPDEAMVMFPEGNWLLKIIKRSEAIRSLLSPKLLAYNHETGFEI
jgi:8-oxo-dGTP diphosphatase